MKRIVSCLILLIILLGASVMFVPVDAQLKVSTEKKLAIDEKLKQLNKPAVKTIHV